MKIGIGLPNPIPGTDGKTLIEWARRAEDAGFSSLATLDRIVYPSYESLISLAAAAAVTDRIGLLTDVVLGPTRNSVMLAKESASVDRLSGGRLTLGLGVGAREDDFRAVGQDFASRGGAFDRELETLHSLWRGERLSESGQASVPQPGREIPVLIGGTIDRAVERTVRWGVGYTAGGGGPDMLAPMAKKIRKAWAQSQREGEPRIVALTYFALGPQAEDGASAYIKDYYAFLGEWADGIAQATPKSPGELKQVASAFADLGVDELILDPTMAELDQVDRLAEAML